jgi:hypothetical protein
MMVQETGKYLQPLVVEFEMVLLPEQDWNLAMSSKRIGVREKEQDLDREQMRKLIVSLVNHCAQPVPCLEEHQD